MQNENKYTRNRTDSRQTIIFEQPNNSQAFRTVFVALAMKIRLRVSTATNTKNIASPLPQFSRNTRKNCRYQIRTSYRGRAVFQGICSQVQRLCCWLPPLHHSVTQGYCTRFGTRRPLILRGGSGCRLSTYSLFVFAQFM